MILSNIDLRFELRPGKTEFYNGRYFILRVVDDAYNYSENCGLNFQKFLFLSASSTILKKARTDYLNKGSY